MPNKTSRTPKPKTDEIFSDLNPLDDRKRWTRAECDDLERYELIDGEILLKMPQKQPHAIAVSRLLFYLMGIFGPDHVQTQATAEIEVSRLLPPTKMPHAAKTAKK